MSSDPSRAVAVANSIHPILVPFPVVCFFGALVTDLAYWQTDDMQWANFSVWLLTAGLVMAGFAVIAALVDAVRARRVRTVKTIWLRVLGAVLAIGLSVVNAFVHSRDAYTSVMPTGLALSGLVVIILLVSGCLGWSMVRRQDSGAMR